MSHQVTINQARTGLRRLIKRALSGEEVIIVKGKSPLVKLVPAHAIKATRKIGADKGLIHISDDFDDTLEEFEEYMA